MRLIAVRLLLLTLVLSVIAAEVPAARAQPATNAASAAASITIDARKVEGQISPLLYGQFGEFMFEDIKGGLHAELIRNRSFEEAPNAIGLSRFWERYPDDRNDDFALNFHWDNKISYPVVKATELDPPEHATRIETGEGVIPRHGLFQSRIPVRAGVEYRGYLWLKTTGFKGQVTVSLEADVSGGEVYAESRISNINGDWKKYEFTLQPARTDPLARFSILPAGEGQLWLDQVSLLPGDAVGGVRRDVFEKIKALKPAFIRWPGGNVAQDYHWLWGVGPRDQRLTWTNLSWKNEPEPSDFGTDEFLDLCRHVGAEPSITVNVEGRGANPQEAAAWVEYCNGPVTTRYGAMRAANGHPEPYRVKYWEIGNEIWGDWVRGHSGAETYGRNFNRYYEAMRAVDSSIKFTGCGDNDMSWNRTVLKLAGERMDYLAIHHYYGTGEMKGDALNLMAHPLYYERFYKEVQKLAREVLPQHAIKLNINEWNTALPLPREHSMESALYAARLMNVFERSGDFVGMSAVSDMVNGWPGGIIQASRHAVFVTPVYLVNRLYSEHQGTQRLSIKVQSPTFDTSLEGKNIPLLDAVASRSADGRELYIKAVNTDPSRSLETQIILNGATAAEPTVSVEILNGEKLDTANSFSQPEAVSVGRSAVRAGQDFSVLLPAHSVSVITLKIRL